MPGLAGMADDVVDALIAAATEELDGPTGWLGRAIGRQTLELRLLGFPCRGGIMLPLPPVASVVSLTYSNGSGGDVAMPPSDIALETDCLVAPVGWPSGENVRIRYVAGYEAVPSRVKVAVQLRVGELAQQMGRDVTLRKEVVEGIGSFEYDTGSDKQRSATSKAVESLLGGLRVMSL